MFTWLWKQLLPRPAQPPDSDTAMEPHPTRTWNLMQCKREDWTEADALMEPCSLEHGKLYDLARHVNLTVMLVDPHPLERGKLYGRRTHGLATIKLQWSHVPAVAGICRYSRRRSSRHHASIEPCSWSAENLKVLEVILILRQSSIEPRSFKLKLARPPVASLW